MPNYQKRVGVVIITTIIITIIGYGDNYKH